MINISYNFFFNVPETFSDFLEAKVSVKARAGMHPTILLLDLDFISRNMGGDISMMSQSVVEGSGP